MHGDLDLMLSMLEWLCSQLTEAEVSSSWGRKKVNVTTAATGIAVVTVIGGWIHGWEPCTLWYPRLAKEGYIPFFVTERKQGEVALINSAGSLCTGRIHAQDGETRQGSGN